jgi:hypothetical protein
MEDNMSKIVKLALILIIAAVAIGARQMVLPSTPDPAGQSSTAAAQVSPTAVTLAAGVLPETKIESYEWVYPLP